MAKVKLKNPQKLISSLLKLVIVILIIVLLTTLLGKLGKDSVKKDIEKVENQKVTIISKQIAPYMGDDAYTLTTLNPKDVINFKVIYTYQLNDSKTIKNYSVEAGVSVKVSDAALAGVKDNEITVSQGVEKNSTLTVTASYNKDKSLTKDFVFEIISDANPPEDLPQDSDQQ